jgi:hypothetical protein
MLNSGVDPIMGNRDNHVFNNVFVDGTHYQTFFANAIHDTFERNIVDATQPTPEQAPFFYFPGDTVHATLEHSDHSLWFRADGNYEQYDAWRKVTRFEANSLAGQDPLFVDPENDDYTLQPESPAFRLGFVPITTRAGPPAEWCWEDSGCFGQRCIQRACQ